MTSLCIVPCGRTKIWDKDPSASPTEAGRVYVGPFATKCRQYAEAFYQSSWCILSAKYGFVWPEEIIPGPYNVSFNDLKTKPIGVEELSIQVLQKRLNSFDEIVVLGGRNYVCRVKACFQGKNIVAPLSKCRGIGFMMSKIKTAIQRGTPMCTQTYFGNTT
jgi:hypothetical protein